MERATTLVLVVLSIFAIGFNAPAFSTLVEDIVNGVTLTSDSVYATTSNGNLTIDISVNNPNYPGYGDGLSSGSVYRFDDVIVLENNVSRTGESVVCVNIQSNDDSLKFYTDSIAPSESINLTLGENESKSVGIEINSSTSGLGLVKGSYTIYVYSGECQ
ncbi:DUF1102 domain-containing protein [Archaeoglobus profundus]|uniref:DUF1102 domain-containing protein n=1 Tax=Archaeoglobus profundus (strain DSM 5631 / JCM 9629 / NBRC 100127 / Av18) TaxID=572546 RepID=D2RHS4_ARCPA|nr:DUF1102 domain-containing protein [Archaeoglobus profundus]ADB57849.1 hypothetical protein Arcpr_0786 [Archaeoglobus profundus DSM 5631]